MRQCLFQEVAQPAPQVKVCVEACSLAFYRRKPRRKGFNENSFYKGGGGKSNRIRSANVPADENRKSIARWGNKSSATLSASGWGSSAPRRLAYGANIPWWDPVTLMPAAIIDGAEIGLGTGARRSTNAVLRLTSDFPQRLPEQTNVCGMKMIYNAADSRVSSICRTVFLAWLTAPRAIFRIF